MLLLRPQDAPHSSTLEEEIRKHAYARYHARYLRRMECFLAVALAKLCYLDLAEVVGLAADQIPGM